MSVGPPVGLGTPLSVCETGRDLLDRLAVDQRVRGGRLISILSYSPIRRGLVQRKRDKILTYHVGHRAAAALIQATGISRRPPCTRCTRANGPWEQCVVVQTNEALQATKGACANCHWNNQGGECSFRTSHSGRAAVPLGSLGHPPTSLMETFSAVHRWEEQMVEFGMPGVAARVKTHARMTAPELVIRHAEIREELNMAQAALHHLLEVLQHLGSEMSEVTMLLSLGRVFDSSREAATASSADVVSPGAPGSLGSSATDTDDHERR
ncbi:hypothetical protein CMUS01_16135 [Colletotrichum musicola]|uniref:Uncharacterized protein n=1 Tax=Colletotrichum musicola TaxID=2175873 RepID=A0A8H6IRE3_9PEZI|nr:hypothetical protein CMUS01_16135 [Colletotrichum musicola]